MIDRHHFHSCQLPFWQQQRHFRFWVLSSLTVVTEWQTSYCALDTFRFGSMPAELFQVEGLLITIVSNDTKIDWVLHLLFHSGHFGFSSLMASSVEWLTDVVEWLTNLVEWLTNLLFLSVTVEWLTNLVEWLTNLVEWLTNLVLLSVAFSFGLTPAAPLQVQSPLIANTSASASLLLNTTGQVQKMDPLLMLQVRDWIAPVSKQGRAWCGRKLAVLFLTDLVRCGRWIHS